MSEPRDALARRVREQLSAHDDVREVREVPMFGGLAFMVDGRLAVSAGGDGDLLVRTRPEDHEGLLLSGGEPAVMGKGRAMGPGWVRVPPSRLHGDAELRRWVQTGLCSGDA